MRDSKNQLREITKQHFRVAVELAREGGEVEHVRVQDS